MGFGASHMGINAGMMSSTFSGWETPDDLFERINYAIEFDLDVCASPENAKCRAFYTEGMQGLEQDWVWARCWMNPPYGREIGKWTSKARETAEHGGLVVGLLPARVDTKWWHRDCKQFPHWFIPGRVKFVGAKNAAPFPSVIVLFWNPIGNGDLPVVTLDNLKQEDTER